MGSSDGAFPKKRKVPPTVLPTNADGNDIAELADGSQVMASKVQIVEVAESS